MVIRCTQRLFGLLDVAKTQASPNPDDWYANLIWIDHRKCLIVLHAETLFPIIAVDVRKDDLRPAGHYFVELVRQALRDEQLPSGVLGELDPETVSFAATASRSVLAHMNQMVEEWKFLAAGRVDLTHPDVINHRLRRTLVTRAGDYRQPLELVSERLDDRRALGS